MAWFNYFTQCIIVIGILAWGVGAFLERRKKPPAPPKPFEYPPPSNTPLLTPPPAPINRTEFLQARIAYLAYMRDVGIEVPVWEEKLVDGKLKKIPLGTEIRRATHEEMIELVNLRDKEHVEQLLDTWSQVQKKQRDPAS